MNVPPPPRSLPPPPARPPAPPPLPPGSLPPEGYVPVGWTGVPRPPRVDALAIVALLCGPAGVFCLVGPVVGIVLGFVSRSRIRRSGGELTGGGLALAAIVVGSLLTAVLVAFFVIGRFVAT